METLKVPFDEAVRLVMDGTITHGPSCVLILKASLDSKPLHDCVVERVKEIQFPQVPASYPTTYTYAFEAM